MYGYAEIKGFQFRLNPGEKVQVPLLDAEPGTDYEIDNFIMFNDGQASYFGQDCSGVSAKAKVVEHFRGPKVTVFKKKRRKDYRVKRGHRQDYTLLQIEEISKK